MIMDDRKKRILQAIIDDYIDTAEPIGSRTIARKHELGLSSATIRNEMADLEEMGYLAQPHTSAGRIPSDKGYRLYVDKLMPVHCLNDDEIQNIKLGMEIRINELSQLIRQATAVLSRFTRYTSMAVTPHPQSSTIKTIQVVPIEAGNALAVVVNNAGIVRNNLIKISEQIAPDMLLRISNILNEKMAGLSPEKADARKLTGLERDSGLASELLKPILDGVADCIDQMDDQEVYVEGTTNILHHPEFSDVAKAREFMNMLDEKTSLSRVLFSSASPDGVSVRIGSENDLTGFRNCSVITISYNVADTMAGTIGIIGPTRMEYPKVISSMRYVHTLLRDEINRLLGQDPGDG